MNNVNYIKISQSYFWSCLTFGEDCPFFSKCDPNLFYFGVGLVCFYAAFVLVIVTDLVLFWPLDKLQTQIDYFISLVRKKVRRVQVDQRKLMSTQERTEKQLKRTEQCQLIVDALRGAIERNDKKELERLTCHLGGFEAAANQRSAAWDDCHGILEF